MGGSAHCSGKMARAQRVAASVQAHGFEQVERRRSTQQEAPLDQPLVVFAGRSGVVCDPAADAAFGARPCQNHRPDTYIERRVTARPDDTDRPAVRPARGRFELGNSLRCGDLGRAGNRTAREQRAEDVGQAYLGSRGALHGRGHLPGGRQGLQVEQRRDAHRPDDRDAGEIVAQQVHDHDVLGAFLGGKTQGGGRGSVGVRVGDAGSRAFHRSRGQSADRRPVEEQLGRHTQHLPVTAVETQTVAGRLRGAERLEEPAGVTAKLGPQSCREVDLVVRALGDALSDRVHGPLDVWATVEHVPERAVEFARSGRRIGGCRDFGILVDPEGGERRPGLIGSANLQRRIEGRRRFIGDEADRPEAGSRLGIDLREDARNLPDGVGHEHLDRASKLSSEARAIVLWEVQPSLHRPSLWPAEITTDGWRDRCCWRDRNGELIDQGFRGPGPAPVRALGASLDSRRRRGLRAPADRPTN